MTPSHDPYVYPPKAPFALESRVPGIGRNSSTSETLGDALTAMRQLAADHPSKDFKARVVDGSGVLVAQLESHAVIGQVQISEFFHRT